MQSPGLTERIGCDLMADINIEVLATQNEVTDAGIKLLEIVTRPECRTMSITKQCELAGISRGTYYNLFRDPNFQKTYTELCKTMLLSGVASSSQALIAQGAMGDTAAIKMILELAGIYQPTARVEHTHTHDAGPTLKEILARRNAID